MAKPKILSEVVLRALKDKPPAKQIDIPDVATPGLSARVTKKGHITWSLRLRVVGEGGQSPRGRRAKGKQHRLTLGTYPSITIKDARATAAAYLKDAEDGSHPVRALERRAISRHDTLKLLVETFLEEYVTNLSSGPNAKSVLRGHVVAEWGDLPADSIEEHDVARLLNKVAKGKADPQTGERVPKPGAASETRKWGSILYAWAVRTGHAHRNPFEKAKSPFKSKPRDRFLGIHEARAVWKAAGTLDKPWCDIGRLLMLTGCRHSEIAHAQWPWVDFSERRVVIPSPETKMKRPFLVPLSPKAISILEAAPRGNEGKFIFSTNGGKSPVWTVNDKVMETLRAAANKALSREMPHWVIHDFRRTLRTHPASDTRGDRRAHDQP